LEKEKLLRIFGNKWAEAKDSWSIPEGKKKKERLIKWIIKKLKIEDTER
jgi:hypothetical protein